MLNRFSHSLIFILLLVLRCSTISAQVVEVPNKDANGNSTGGAELFNQASFGFNGTNPNVSFKTLKLSAIIGKSDWDLYVYNSVNAFTINRNDSLEVFGKDLLNQTGGLFNIALGKTLNFAYGKDPELKSVVGGQLEFRTGMKMMDPQSRPPTGNFLVPIHQSTLDIRYLIPLVQPSFIKNKNNLKNVMVGNLSFRVFVGYMHVFEKEYDDLSKRGIYYQTFKVSPSQDPTRAGQPPPYNLFTANAEVNLFITNTVFLSFGYTITKDLEQLNYESEIPPSRTFISLSYSGQSKK